LEVYVGSYGKQRVTGIFIKSFLGENKNLKDVKFPPSRPLQGTPF
jgi:hypothetical protein